MRVDLSPDVMARAFRVHAGLSSVPWRMFFTALFVVLGLAGLYLASQQRPLVGSIAAAFAVVGLLIYFLKMPILRWRLARQYAHLGEGERYVEMEFGPDALVIRTDTTEARLPWDRFVRWKEADGLILAYRQPRLFNVIPVDQVGDEVASLARRRLGGKL